MIQWQPGMTLEIWEKLAIQQAFLFYRGNKTQTAHCLGISIRTLDTKLEKYESDKRAEIAATERRRLERNTIATQQRTPRQAGPELHDASSGARVESAPTPRAEPEMPMPERMEVQEMLPTKTAKGRPGRPRAGI